MRRRDSAEKRATFGAQPIGHSDCQWRFNLCMSLAVDAYLLDPSVTPPEVCD